MPNANGFADFGKLPQYTQNDPMKNRPEVKGNGPNNLSGLIAQLQKKFDLQQAKSGNAPQTSSQQLTPALNSFLGNQNALQPEAPKSEGTDDILTNEQRKQGQEQEQGQQSNKPAAQASFDNMSMAVMPGDIAPVMSVSNGGVGLLGLRDFITKMNGESGEDGKRTQNQNNKAADAYTQQTEQEQADADANFDPDHYYEDLKNWLGNNNRSGGKDAAYLFMTNGTPEEWRAMLSDNTMKRYYQDAYKQFGDIANDDAAFQRYWDYYKPRTVEEINDPNNEAYWATNMTDYNLINDMNTALMQNETFETFRYPENATAQQIEAMNNMLNADSQSTGGQQFLNTLNYITLQNILSKAEPGSLPGLKSSEINDLSVLDPSYFGTKEEAGGVEPERRGNWDAYVPTNTVNPNSYLGFLVPDAYLPNMNLADQISYIFPDRGIIGQRKDLQQQQSDNKEG